MNRAAWGPLLVAIACAGGIAWAESRAEVAQPEVAPAELSAEASRLLGGLQVGDKVAGWTVDAIASPAPRQIRIDLAHDDVSFSITVAPLGELPESPVLQTERFAIYYGHAQPEGTRLPRGGLRAILHELKRRIEEREDGTDL
jgi:hypothetical protein